MNHKKHGVLLVHIGIVLAIFVLILAYSLPRITAFNTWILYADIQKMRTFFLFVQRVAMVTGQTHYIQFFPHEGMFTGAGRKEYLSSHHIFGFLPHVSGPPSHPQNPITKYSTFDSDRIACYPSGIIQAGTVYIKNKKNTLMYALSCSVSSASYVRIYKYESGWKRIS